MRDTVKRLFAMDMLYAFIVGALAVLVPIYLVDRGIDIVSIGLLFSVFPLVYMVLRILFAAIADHMGTKAIEILESFAMLIAIAVYAFTRSAQGAAIAQFTEGVREASFWATARTDVITSGARREAARALAYFAGLRQLADGAGRIGVGFMILYLSFMNTFSVLFALSLVLLVMVFTINKDPFKRLPKNSEVMRKIFRRRSDGFWYNAFGLATQQMIPNMLLMFLLPLYAYTVLGFDYYGTAAVVAVYSVVMAVANLAALRAGFGARSLLLITLISAPAFLLLPFTGHSLGLTLAVVFILGVGGGTGNILAEYILCDEVSRRRDLSTEISVTFFPLRISEFLFLALGGLVISSQGYGPLLLLCSVLTFIFVVYARGELKNR